MINRMLIGSTPRIRLTIAVVLTMFLVACNAPSDRESVARASVAAVPVSEPATKVDECDHVADLFDMLVKKKADGWVEADALADMSARGEYSLGYVVDGVFGDRFGPGGGAMARHDTLAACRRIADGGTLY